MDHLLSEHNSNNNIVLAHSAAHSADAKITLYGHFNGGLAMGMVLECLVLQYVLGHRQRRQTTNDFAFDDDVPLFNDGPLLGLVSGIFVVGCVGLTLVRAYGTIAPQKGWASPKKEYRKLSANRDSMV